MTSKVPDSHDRGEGNQVFLVTSARRAHSEEMSGRLKRYLISMSIRTICVALAIFVLTGWLRIVGILVGLVLPWLAVVFANAGPIAGDEEPAFVQVGRTELDAGPAAEATSATAAEAAPEPHSYPRRG